MDVTSVKLYIRSKENYRQKSWEQCELRVTNKGMEEGSKPAHEDTEIRAEVAQNG